MKIKTMKVPPLSDVRYLQTGVLLAYSFAARQFFYIERAHFVALLCVLWAIAFDLMLGKLFYKQLIFPLSACIIGLSSTILIDARNWLYYLLVVTLAIASKALVTHRGRHFFNPTNFAVVIVLASLPLKVTGIPSLFAGYLWPSVVFAILGLGTVLYARQTAVSFSWIAGFIVLAGVRAVLKGGSFWLTVGPVLGSSFLLFSFHMISDPATVPSTLRRRVAFGLLTALFDAVWRYYEVPFGMFYALFLSSALLPLLAPAGAPRAA